MSTTTIRRVLTILLVFTAIIGVRLVGQAPTDAGRAGGAPAGPGNGTDPDQIKNVAGDKEHEATRKKLAEQLTKILTDVGDPRLVEKDCRFEKPPFTDFGPRKK